MSKAKEILEKLKDKVFMTEKGLVSFAPIIGEAIAELEAQQQRSCEGCTILPFVLTELAKKNGGKCGTCKRFVKDNFQPKEQ